MHLLVPTELSHYCHIHEQCILPPLADHRYTVVRVVPYSTSEVPGVRDMAARHIFYGKQLSGTAYEKFVDVFSRRSSHGVELAGATAAYLRLNELGLEEKRKNTCIVDLGAGPGICLGSILRHASLAREVASSACTDHLPTHKASNESALSVWCVDPFLHDAAAASDKHVTTLPAEVDGRRMEIIGGRVHFVKAGAVEFVEDCRATGRVADRILMKEMIHHVREYDRLCEGLRFVLRPGTGVALIAGRTPSDVMPWFPQAAKLFKESCMDVERIYASVDRVPGLHFETFERSFDVHLKLAEWCTLLRGRFWSNLASISDEEMEQGIAEVRDMYNNDDAAPVVFPDHFTFVRISCEEKAADS